MVTLLSSFATGRHDRRRRLLPEPRRERRRATFLLHRHRGVRQLEPQRLDLEDESRADQRHARCAERRGVHLDPEGARPGPAAPQEE